MISPRTKAAPAAALVRGVRLGNPNLQAGSYAQARAANAVKTGRAQMRPADVLPFIEQAWRAGATTSQQLANSPLRDISKTCRITGVDDMEAVQHFRARSMLPADLGPALQALWWAQAGDWDQAHACVQTHEGDPDWELVHAHLHRQESDLYNAKSWYDAAGRPVPAMSVQDEWTALATEFSARAEPLRHGRGDHDHHHHRGGRGGCSSRASFGLSSWH